MKIKSSLTYIGMLVILFIIAELSIDWADRYFTTNFNLVPKLVITSCFGFILGLVFSGENIAQVLTRGNKRVKPVWTNIIICTIVVTYITLNFFNIIPSKWSSSILSSINEYFLYFLVLGVYLPKTLSKDDDI